MTTRSLLLSALLVTLTAGCGGPKEDTVLVDVKKYIQTNLQELRLAAEALTAAAPVPDADGWSAETDAAAVDAMKVQWKKARVSYERVEGAIAVLFPELDESTDQRYDAFIETEGDPNLFDGEGVTGIHALERILWVKTTPASVLEFERGLPNYKAAATPATLAEATDFKTQLCVRLVNDAKKMENDFSPLALDTASAFRGVIGSMAEQVEKVQKAASGEEESRYAQYTLADMKANVEGGLKTFELFKAWLEDKGGSAESKDVAAGFDRLKAAYAALPGDSLPAVPATWSSVTPSAADLQTPFGKLYGVLRDEADEGSTTSTVSAMNRAADKLGIPQLPQN